MSQLSQTVNKGRSKPVTVNTSAKKPGAWINVSFEDAFGLRPPERSSTETSKDTNKMNRKRPREQTQPSQQWPILTGKKIPEKQQDLWVDKHMPKNKDDLAVHKKKVSEVESWLETNRRSSVRRGNRILLLTGPAGVGKTATIKVLAKEMKLQMHEWSNPNQESFVQQNPGSIPDFLPYGGGGSESQSQQFRDFLLRANRYESLQIDDAPVSSQKLILVEEFPNVFFRDTTQFHALLREYSARSETALVFIISDSAGGDSNERLLFPPALQMELAITNISFNPVAPTLMTKVLQKIATVENKEGGARRSVPGRQELEGLVTASSGDIRAAINSLQFMGISGVSNRAVKRKLSSTHASNSKDKAVKDESPGTTIGCRDNSLFLFRALGKILYCKRDQTVPLGEHERLPSHLAQHERPPLLVNPEDTVEKSQLSGEFFTTFLHQNYTEFFSDLDDLVRATDYLSDADFLTINWESRASMREYGASVATRGLMHSNATRAKTGGSGQGWKPIHKPQWFAVNRKMRENISTASGIFAEQCQAPRELQTQVIPYMAKLSRGLKLNYVQQRLVREITTYSKGKLVYRGGMEKLDETEVSKADGEEEEEGIPVRRMAEEEESHLIQHEEEQDEEIIIEEYED